MNSKDNLRKIYKEKRNSFHNKGEIITISDKICATLEDSTVFQNAKNILTFYPKGSELNTIKLLEKYESIKKFYLPRCSGQNLLVCPYKTGDKLLLNKFKIYEPLSEPVLDLEILDIIITPALCADKNFHRIGYGAGYYDRFFENKNLNAKKIIIIPDFALLDKIPSDDYDKKCDIIITEKRILSRL